MRPVSLVVAAGFLASLCVPAGARATSEDDYRHGRVRQVEPGVTLQRATEVSAEEALANLPFLPGDRVWSDALGRVEFQFPDASVVRLDSRSKLDYAGHEEGRDERIVLRLWSGSLVARVRTEAGRFAIETPAGSVELLERAMVRVDVEEGAARVSVYRGAALLDDGHGRTRVEAGERAALRWGAAASAPEPFDIAPEDDFARWDEARESEERWAARSSEYLPTELDPYAGELERNGSWRYEAAAGYVWTPRVASGWSPYTNGHWSWTAYGWTWVPYESWGWAPSHYGRWGFSVSFGWYWAPGRAWGPGWVSWGVGNGYVGWCPLGWRDRPVFPWGGHNRGYAVPRRAGHGGWNVVREGDFGHRDVARRRVPLAGLDSQALRVAESPRSRPTRDGRALLPTSSGARAISRRPTPGDFVRELAVDNRTTIPSPGLRRDPPLRDDGGSRRPQASASSARPRPESSEPAATERAAPAASSLRWRAPRSAPAAPRGGTATRERSESRPGDARASRGDAGARSRSQGTARRDAGRASRPQALRVAPAPRSEAPRRVQPRAERQAPRAESSARASRGDSGARASRGDSGARASGGRAAARPPRPPR